VPRGLTYDPYGDGWNQPEQLNGDTFCVLTGGFGP
jgi:hypothetical protein